MPRVADLSPITYEPGFARATGPMIWEVSNYASVAFIHNVMFQAADQSHNCFLPEPICDCNASACLVFTDPIEAN